MTPLWFWCESGGKAVSRCACHCTPKVDRRRVGMEFGDKANGRGTALVSAFRGKIRAIAPWHVTARRILFDFWGQQDCKGPGGGLS